MKKIITLIISIMLLAVCAFSAACSDATTYVSKDATDLLQEDFGIAVKKGDTEMLAAVNAVVNEWNENGKMEKYFDFYEAHSADSTTTAPEGLDITWDFGDATETLTVYTESGFAPYEYIYEEAYYGIDIAIASQVAVNLGLKLEIQDVLFDTIISCLENDNGKAIAAAGLTINPERAAQVDFSEVYSSSTLSIVSAEDKAYSSLASLEGLKIGVQEGTSGDLIASAAITADGYTFTTTDENDEEVETTIKLTAEVAQYKTYAAALAALQTGKIDVIFMDKVPSLLLIANL